MTQVKRATARVAARRGEFDMNTFQFFILL